MNPNGIHKYSLNSKKNNSFISKIGKALSSEERLNILRALHHKPQTVTELSKLLNTANANVIFHLKVLEEAKLVYYELNSDSRKKTQVWFIDLLSLSLDFSEEKPDIEYWQDSMPVGLYVAADCYDYLRMATDSEFLRIDTQDAFNSIRVKAQLICTNGGIITYAFSNEFALKRKVKELSFSLEICSEISSYRNDWKSDITFSVNETELATYTSPGDYGGNRGRLNPPWYSDSSSQYGDLVTVAINDNGVFVNNSLMNPTVTLDMLKINMNKKILFTIETKRDAKNYGGFNIFGKNFGNYNQDIVLTAIYE